MELWGNRKGVPLVQAPCTQDDIAYVEAMLDHLLGAAASPGGSPPPLSPQMQGIACRIGLIRQALIQCVEILSPFKPVQQKTHDAPLLPQLQRALTKSAQDSGYGILAQIINESTDAITVFTPKGVVLFSNRAARALAVNLLTDLPIFMRLKQKAGVHGQKAREDYYCKDTGRWLRISLNHIQWFGEQSAYLMVVNDTTEYRQREEKILYQARMDGLTGVYNRTGGLAVLREWLQQEEKFPLCVCFIDIDYLKQINDCYGHHEGDALIAAVAQAIRTCCRSEDLCMRIGGDEFLIVLPGMNYATAKRTVSGVMDSLCSHLAGLNKPYNASFSCGIEEVPHMQQLLLDELIQRADRRMYEAKRLRHAQGKPIPSPARAANPTP